MWSQPDRCLFHDAETKGVDLKRQQELRNLKRIEADTSPQLIIYMHIISCSFVIALATIPQLSGHSAD